MTVPAVIRYSILGLKLAALVATSSLMTFAQPEALVQDVAPPPLKIISRAERDQLNASKDAKARVKLTIEMSETHLLAAETKTSEQNYDGAAAAAGKYWALIEDVFMFMKTMKQESNKARDLYKRIELTLRAHAPRLSTIRRSTPAEYSVWIKAIEDYARSGRTEALNSFYGHTVVHDRQPKQTEKKPPEKPAP